jgi:hypothetical protein
MMHPHGFFIYTVILDFIHIFYDYVNKFIDVRGYDAN